MKKLQLDTLKISSFVTKEQGTIKGGVSVLQCSNNRATCALACSFTNGDRVCKDPDNVTVIYC